MKTKNLIIGLWVIIIVLALLCSYFALLLGYISENAMIAISSMVVVLAGFQIIKTRQIKE